MTFAGLPFRRFGQLETFASQPTTFWRMHLLRQNKRREICSITALQTSCLRDPDGRGSCETCWRSMLTLWDCKRLTQRSWRCCDLWRRWGGNIHTWSTLTLSSAVLYFWFLMVLNYVQWLVTIEIYHMYSYVGAAMCNWLNPNSIYIYYK